MPEVGEQYIVTINDKKMSGEIVKETPKNFHFKPNNMKTVKVLSKDKFKTEFKARKVAGQKKVKGAKAKSYFKGLAKDEPKKKKSSTRTKKKVTKEEFEEARKSLRKMIK